MTDKPENPPAFACAAATPDFGDWQSGMNLRDYFAAKAMQGELSSQTPDSEWGLLPILAERSYKIADAMLAEREKSQ